MIEKLIKVQQQLKAPKGQRNSFGNYNYRSAEDIIEAVKPLLHAEGLLMIISDSIVSRAEDAAPSQRTLITQDEDGEDQQEITLRGGHRFYIEATVTVTDGEKNYTTKAYAREEETKKGMDAAQITGAASSYARKYALNGMFAIDDTKDADATNHHGKGKQEEAEDDDINFD